jgi:hypothetical protein
MSNERVINDEANDDEALKLCIVKAMVPASIRIGSITTKPRDNFDGAISLDQFTSGKHGRLLSAC